MVSGLALLFLGTAFIRPADAVVLACGTTINTPNTTVTLTANVGPCLSTNFGVSIRADNVTLDLNGFKVIGDGTNDDFSAFIGLYVRPGAGGVGGNNVTIKNGTVTRFNSGIFAEEVFGTTVTGMTLVDNIGPDLLGLFGEGFQSFQGGGHTITNSRVIHNGPFAGIVVYDSSNNKITNNQVLNNNILDTSGHHGGGGPIMQDIGIWVVNLTASNPNNAINNLVQGNSVSGNGLDGIQIANFTNNNTVRNNSVVNNGFGQPAGNGFRDGTGIAIFGSSNLVESNNASSNGGNGIGILGSGANGKTNTVRTNAAVANGSAPNSVAFDLFDSNLSPPCDANTWASNNEITKNQACIN